MQVKEESITMKMLTNAYNYVATGADWTAQRAGSLVIRVKELKSNPDIFQKTCQIAAASIVGFNLYCGGTHLSKLTVTLLNTANMHNFLGILKIPYKLVYNINSQTVNALKLQEALELQLTQTDDNPQQVSLVARQAITDQLTEMDVRDIAYRKESDFKNALEARVKLVYPAANLDGLRVPVSTPLLNKLSSDSFLALDLVCIPLYLHGWNLSVSRLAFQGMQKMGLAKQAQTIGQTKVFQWAGQQNLGTWAWSLCSLSFGLQMLEAMRQLRDEPLTPTQRMRMEWTRVSSAAELALSTAGLMQVSPGMFTILTIITKSIGILSIAYRPNMRFFENPA
jgi:hypothetical protein